MRELVAELGSGVFAGSRGAEDMLELEKSVLRTVSELVGIPVYLQCPTTVLSSTGIWWPLESYLVGGGGLIHCPCRPPMTSLLATASVPL